MKNANRIFLLAISMFVGACLMVIISGCQTAGTVRDTARNVGERIVESDSASLVVRYAVAKYVGGDIERAGRILEVVGEVREVVTGDAESVYLAKLRELVRDEIDWDQLDPADRYAADELLTIVVEEVRASVGDGVLSAEDRMTIATLLDLIEAGAAAGAPDESESAAVDGLGDHRYEGNA